ncbi:MULTISPECIES: hypothetical protein [unclassified Bradyrhizobium]|uniref:hypothetical protein n=1 Tax=unclassified Bradyrhizobium TaxID=2631580 RepID=UPI0028ED36B9|nr:MULTISPECIES: hypothetical protein [unclassified Bradyrhizobium]
MTEPITPHPFDETEALAWLRSQPMGRLTISAAELGRRWGWNRMRTSRRLKAWERVGLIRRNAESIIATGSVTSTIKEGSVSVTEVAAVTGKSRAEAAGRYTTPVNLASFIVALAMASVSAAYSIDGLTAIFAGAFWPVIMMGAVLEAGKLVAAAWFTEHWNSAPLLLRNVLVLIIGALMGLNAIGVFGVLPRAHLGHMASVDLALANRTADVEARLGIQSRKVADIDRRTARIDAAISESLANLQTERARIQAQRQRAQAEVGPIRYLAELMGIPATDIERAVRLLTLALVAVVDPMAVTLLLAAGLHRRVRSS